MLIGMDEPAGVENLLEVLTVLIVSGCGKASGEKSSRLKQWGLYQPASNGNINGEDWLVPVILLLLVLVAYSGRTVKLLT